jgi:hypothetical protein
MKRTQQNGKSVLHENLFAGNRALNELAADTDLSARRPTTHAAMNMPQ